MELKMWYESQVVYIMYKYFWSSTIDHLILLHWMHAIVQTCAKSNNYMHTKIKQTKKHECEIYIHFFSQNSILWHLFQSEQ